MKTLLKILGVLVLVVVLVGAAGYGWASVASNRTLSETFETHSVDFPIPFPLTAEEIASLRVTEEEARAIALDRAKERGRHLLAARYACLECHGENFAGGVMVDAFPIGKLLGPNLTTGRGGKTANYSPSDWNRAVRHGVLPDGRPSIMPSEEFVLMSDQELSDIIAYIQAQPPVDNEVPPPSLGPLGKMLVATGQITLSATLISSHTENHIALPPPSEVTVEFGRHLAMVCSGCHGQALVGGPIVGGDPSWPPAKNLTPHESGLGGWTYEQFAAVMRDGVRPDGTPTRNPMGLVTPFGQQMTEVEMQAMWLYLQSLPPTPTR